MSALLLSSEASIALLRAELQKELTAAAEPLIQVAVKEAEKAIRDRLGRAVLAVIENNYSVERMGTDLRITVHHIKKNETI